MCSAAELATATRSVRVTRAVSRVTSVTSAAQMASCHATGCAHRTVPATCMGHKDWQGVTGMTGRKGIFSVGLAAVLAAAGGTAWAVTQTEDPGPDRPAIGSVPTTGKVAEGRAPSGREYTIFRIDPAQFKADPMRWFCTEIVTEASSTRGCDPAPDADGRIDGQPLSPSFALLGTDRFFSLIAPEGVTAMEVEIKGQAKATGAQSIDAGPAGTLLLAMVGGPQVTSRDPSSSRDYVVRLLDSNGDAVSEFAMSDPGRDE